MIPIHENNCHWTFVFLDPEAKELTYYDSFRSDGTNIMHNILAFIEEEHNHNNMAFNKESWNLKNDPNTPLQDDKHSCGYLAILNAECVALQKPLNHSQQDVPDIRNKIRILLISEGLDDPYIYDIERS